MLLHQRANHQSCRPETITSENQYAFHDPRVSRPLNMQLACKQTLFYFSFRCFEKHHKSPAVYILSPALNGL